MLELVRKVGQTNSFVSGNVLVITSTTRDQHVSNRLLTKGCFEELTTENTGGVACFLPSKNDLFNTLIANTFVVQPLGCSEAFRGSEYTTPRLKPALRTESVPGAAFRLFRYEEMDQLLGAYSIA